MLGEDEVCPQRLLVGEEDISPQPLLVGEDEVFSQLLLADELLPSQLPPLYIPSSVTDAEAGLISTRQSKRIKNCEFTDEYWKNSCMLVIKSAATANCDRQLAAFDCHDHADLPCSRCRERTPTSTGKQNPPQKLPCSISAQCRCSELRWVGEPARSNPSICSKMGRVFCFF